MANPTLLLTNPSLSTPESPLLLHARWANITRMTYDIQGVGVQDRFVTVPTPEGSTEAYHRSISNATIEISAVGKTADLLFADREDAGLLVRFHEHDGRAVVNSAHGVKVVDGYQKTAGERQAGYSTEFEYTYHWDRPLTYLSGARNIELLGGAKAYIWDAYVQVRNGTGVVQTYQTGASAEEGSLGVTRSEHYEYLLLELDGLEATLMPGGLKADLFAPVTSFDLDGEARLPQASGSFTAGSDLYRSDGSQSLTLAGNLSMAVAPRPDTDDRGALNQGDEQSPRVFVRMDGDLRGVSIPPLDEGLLLSTTELVAVGAGGATLLGAAAWYLYGVKGASAAALLARPRNDDEEDEAAAASQPSPGELLFDTDRFTLYHLVRSRPGLSARECGELTGIQAPEDHLSLLAEHGLLVRLAESPPRYALPGRLDEEMASDVTYLRDPDVRAVASLLALHGLMPEDLLFSRAANARHAVGPARVREVVRGLVRRGLAIQERGPEGLVVDPTQELFDVLDVMGEPEVRAGH